MDQNSSISAADSESSQNTSVEVEMNELSDNSEDSMNGEVSMLETSQASQEVEIDDDANLNYNIMHLINTLTMQLEQSTARIKYVKRKLKKIFPGSFFYYTLKHLPFTYFV